MRVVLYVQDGAYDWGPARQRWDSSRTNRAGEHGALRALDPRTGERRWELRYTTPSFAGVLSTASGVVFSGDGDGNFLAVDSRTGENLWHFQMGASADSFQSGVGICAPPITYMLDGRQYVVISAGTALLAFGLPSVP